MEYLDTALIFYGGLMVFSGFVLYVILNIWPHLKVVKPSIQTVPSIMQLFGMLIITNEIVVGLGRQISLWSLIFWTVVMIMCSVWLVVTLVKFFKLHNSEAMTP